MFSNSFKNISRIGVIGWKLAPECDMHLRFLWNSFFMHDYSYSFVEDLILGPKAFILPLEFWNNYFSSLCIGNCFFHQLSISFPPYHLQVCMNLMFLLPFLSQARPFLYTSFFLLFFNIFCCCSGCLLISLSYTSILPVFCTHWPFLLYKYIRPQSHLEFNSPATDRVYYRNMEVPLSFFTVSPKSFSVCFNKLLVFVCFHNKLLFSFWTT